MLSGLNTWIWLLQAVERPRSRLQSMAKLAELQVLIPYKDLMELLEASRQIEQLKKDNKRLHKQLDALRTQFIELMEAFGDLKRYVSD